MLNKLKQIKHHVALNSEKIDLVYIIFHWISIGQLNLIFNILVN